MFGLGCAGALTLGALAVMRLPLLPPAWTMWCVLVGAGAIVWRAPRWSTPRWRWLGALLFGFALAALHAHAALALRMPAPLAGHDVRIEGRIEGLADARQRHTRFDFIVEAVVDNGAAGATSALLGKRLRLGWYQSGDTPLPALGAGSRWQLDVRLKRPRGVLNPGGFDFEKYALQRRIAATGYVRDPASARRLSAAAGIDAWRMRQSTRIAAAVPGDGARFVRALALGDTRGLGERDWEILRATGLTHLIAISGFHVGMVAGFGALLAGLLYRLLPALGRRLPRPQGAAIAALLFALGYAAVAGFALPTVRTVLMIAAALLARLLRRAHSTTQAFALALAAVVLIDPLALLAPGFWLSFLGVGWLLWCLPRDAQRGKLRTFLSAQGVATLALLPLTVWFFGQASLAGPLANLVGIPWISLGVVPLSLLGLAVDPLWPAAGGLLFNAAALAMDGLWLGLERIAAWPWALLWLPEASLAAIGLALLGAFWLLLPRGVPGKPLALLLWLPLLWPAGVGLERGEAEITLIDVGQGLALLLRTADHTLLYDTGPAYADGLDLGEAAVLPTLHALGVGRVDAVVVSHGDNDHAGGFGAVWEALAPARVWMPEGWSPAATVLPAAAAATFAARRRDCRRDVAWRWDGVEFRFLHPPEYFPYLRNDSSCVLRVQTAHGVVLLPGDIGATVEARLLREQPTALRADVLVVPHHGSRTSSSPEFVRQVRPQLALLATGSGNRFGLPHPQIVQRYRQAGIHSLDTATHGAIRVQLAGGGMRVVESMRVDRRRFWNDDHVAPVER